MITEEKQDKVFTRDFFRKVGKAIHDYNLIEDGDRILVGVSGGKDSLALLEVLAMRAKDPKQNYTVIAAHIAVEDVAYEVDSDYLRAFCERLGVEYVYRTCVHGIGARCFSILPKSMIVRNWPWAITGMMPWKVF